MTQRLDLPRRKLRNGSPPAGCFASEAVYAKKGKKRMRTMKKNGKRWLAMVLSFVMCFGLLQTTALAARNYVVPVYAVGVDSSNKVVSVMFSCEGVVGE